jgi:integrase
MALYKRGDTWWIDVSTAGGKRVRASTGTSDKKAAKEYHDKVKAETWRTERLGEKVQRSWDEAALRWLQETEHKATHQEDIGKLAWLHPRLRGRLLSEISSHLVSTIGDLKKKESSPSTANRHLGLIRSILRRASLDWEWLEKCPRIRLYPEPSRRVRWLTQEQAHAVLNELPEHLAEMMRFSLATGLRQRNVARLSWSQIDLNRRAAWIHADQAKAGRGIPVALNETAIRVLKRQQGKHSDFVFTYAGRPIRQVNTKAWKKALTRAGIADFRWHDLRHTWASWLTQAGVPLNALQEMGAWKSSEMVRRYAHLAPEQLQQYAEKVDKLMADDTSTSQVNPRPALKIEQVLERYGAG